MKYFTRDLESCLKKAIKTRPLVYLNGPRQTGKSTLVRNLYAAKDINYVNLDSPVNLAAAKADPAGFLQSLPSDKLNVIDEIQEVPEIFRHIKMSIDENRIHGRGTGLYLLTGSANLMALPDLSKSLVGRMSVLTLLPFSSAEYKQTGENFIVRLFGSKPEYRAYKKYNLIDIIKKSGFPEPSLATSIVRKQWYSDYLTTLLQRDIQAVADIRNPSKVTILLSILAMKAGSLLNNSLAAQETGLDIKTYERYKTAAVNTFILFEVPAWSKPSRVNKRYTKSPKLYFTDTNLLTWLLRQDMDDIYRHDRIVMGHIFENYIASEILKNSCSIADLDVSHFRTSDQKEVDFVLEKGGKVIGIQVKLNSSPDNHDFAGLKLLREAVGRRFLYGIVIYPGTDLVPFGEDLWAVPVCYLWEQ